jgi:hypothetical protein
MKVVRLAVPFTSCFFPSGVFVYVKRQKKKVMFTLKQAMNAQKGVEV